MPIKGGGAASWDQANNQEGMVQIWRGKGMERQRQAFSQGSSLQGLLLKGKREAFPPGGGLREWTAAQIREAG